MSRGEAVHAGSPLTRYTFPMLKPTARRAAIALFAALSVAPALQAQGSGAGGGAVDVRPPAPTDPGKPNYIVPYLLVFVLAAAAVGLSVLPSQRTHQD